jgi:hypothetical protein
MNKEAKKLFLANRIGLLQKIAEEAEENENKDTEEAPKKKRGGKVGPAFGAAGIGAGAGAAAGLGGGMAARSVKGVADAAREGAATADVAADVGEQVAKKGPGKLQAGAEGLYKHFVPEKGLKGVGRRAAYVGIPSAIIAYAVLRARKKKKGYA